MNINISQDYLKYQRETNLYGKFNMRELMIISKRSMMSHHNELIEKVKEYTDNHEKFVANGNKAAGTRARKALSEIGKLTKSQRKAIQDVKNAV